MKKLNLGCGKDYRQDYINLDFNKGVKADVYHDLNKFPYPFEDNTFDEIYCHHVLERVDNLLKVMEELWRINKPGAKIHVIGPYSASFEVHVDIIHKRGFNTQSFRRCFKKDDVWNFYTKAKFDVLEDYIIFYSYMKPIEYLINRFRSLKNIYERHFAYIIQAKKIKIILRVVK